MYTGYLHFLLPKKAANIVKIADLQAHSANFSQCLTGEPSQTKCLLPTIPSACQGGVGCSNIIILGGRGLKSLGTRGSLFTWYPSFFEALHCSLCTLFMWLFTLFIDWSSFSLCLFPSHILISAGVCEASSGRRASVRTRATTRGRLSAQENPAMAIATRGRTAKVSGHQ